MKDLNTIRKLLEDIKTGGIHVGLPITKEECVDLKVVIEEYIERRNLSWNFSSNDDAQYLRDKYNLLFGGIFPKRALGNYFAWIVKPNNVDDVDSGYFDTK